MEIMSKIQYTLAFQVGDVPKCLWKKHRFFPTIVTGLQVCLFSYN